MKEELKFDFSQSPNVHALYQDYINSKDKSISYRLLVFSKCIHRFLAAPINLNSTNKQKEEKLRVQLAEMKKILSSLINQAEPHTISENVEKTLQFAMQMLGLIKNRESIIEQYLKKLTSVKSKPSSSHSNNVYLTWFLLYCCSHHYASKSRTLVLDNKQLISQTPTQSTTSTSKSSVWFFILPIVFAAGWRAVRYYSNLSTESHFLDSLLQQRTNLLRLIEVSLPDLLGNEEKNLSDKTLSLK